MAARQVSGNGARQGAPGAADASSHVQRTVRPQPCRASRRVVEYLRVLGLNDSARAQAIAAECATASSGDGGDLDARAAMRRAQARVAAWKQATFVDVRGDPDPLWLRAFVGAHPEAFLDNSESARRAAQSFGDVAAGLAPRTARFSQQRFGRTRLPAWLRGLLPPLLLALVVTLAVFGPAVGARGARPLELLWVALFAGLLAHAALGFWTAVRGFSAAPIRRKELPSTPPLPHRLLRVAVVSPIYHEDAARVFAHVAAMRESLSSSAVSTIANGAVFEMFVLSDSQDPLIAAEEERAFRRITARADEASRVPVYYRRRGQNERQKAGNLAEFFERFGQRYEYVVVLDADSLMRGETMAELVRRIACEPQLALLQAPIVPIRGETLLCRTLQWSASMAGPLVARGLQRWSGPHGNYYGHNAIIRTRAFLECCALPALSGTPPLGGHLLSHDFVEAALLCRAGWEVRSAPDLAGSYEGLPPTLAAYVARDRRWCQGNLQHLRVALVPGFPAMSRIHLLLGAAAYLAGPTWLIFAVIGLWLAPSAWLGGGPAPGSMALVASLALVAALLLGPHVLGGFAVLVDRERRRQHGGAMRLLASFFCHSLITAALSPILMLHHTRIVLLILLGRAVGWGAQRRAARSGWAAAVRNEVGTTLVGLTWVASIWLLSSGDATSALLLWSAPLWLPLAAAIPISVAVSSTQLGARSEERGLLLVPSETAPDPLAERCEELRLLTEGDLAGRFRDLILDPVLVRAHLARLEPAPALPGGQELCERALRVGPAGLSELERQSLLADAGSVRFLHVEAWCHWPVETWQVARDRPQLPDNP